MTPTPHEQGAHGEQRDRRERLKGTFGEVAHSYQHARPDYPEPLFDDLISSTGVRPGDRLLEIGCASGKATMPLVDRGFSVTCIELSESLAGEALRNLEGSPLAAVETSSFEDWDARGRTFDLLLAANSWHWLDPAMSYAKAWDVLRPGGGLAIWGASHVFPDGGDPFFRELQDVYEEIGEARPEDASWPQPGELADIGAEIEQTGLFAVVLVRHYDWELVYDADGYVALLSTFSNHIAMEQWQTERLYGEIRRRLASREDGRVRRHWGTVLQVARRLDVAGGLS